MSEQNNENVGVIYIPPNVAHAKCCRGDDVRHETISAMPIPFDDGHACTDCCPCPDCGECRAEQFERDPSGWDMVPLSGRKSWRYSVVEDENQELSTPNGLGEKDRNVDATMPLPIWVDEWRVAAIAWLGGDPDSEPPEPPSTLQVITLIGACDSLREQNKQLKEALEAMRTPPLILEGDSAVDVAGWFVKQIDAALGKAEESR